MNLKSYLTIFVIFSLITSLSFAFCGTGDGSIGNPYLICTPDDLNEIRNGLTPLHYKLNNSIDLNVSPYNESEGWEPIGNLTNRFGGGLNGDGYTISNLYINKPTEDYIGLFGYTDQNYIKNINLVNVNLTGRYYVGGLAGYDNYASIDNINVTGTIYGTNATSGLVGEQFFGIISNSFSNCEVNGTTYTGGIAGNSYGRISNCYSTGNVNGINYTGGLLGASTDGNISFCYATGNVNSQGVWMGGLIGRVFYGNVTSCYTSGNIIGNISAGGLVGSNFGGIIKDSYAMGNVTGTGIWIGGLVGSNYGTIIDSFSIGSVLAADKFGGLVGYNDESGTNISNSYYNNETSNTNDIGKGEPKTTIEMKTLSTFSTWDIEISENDLNEGYPYLGWENDSETTWLIYQTEQAFSGGTGSIADPYMICTADELDNVRLDLTAHYKLNNSIDLDVAPYNTGNGWLPIGNYSGSFTGSFDGDGHTVSNLYFNGNGTTNPLGLFGYNLGNISNVTLTNINLTGYGALGGLVGYNNGRIINVIVNGNIICLSASTNYVGGLTGLSENSHIINSHFTGEIITNSSAWGWIGGLVGYLKNNSIVNSSSNINVSEVGASGSATIYIGGLVGEIGTNNPIITNSYSIGNVNCTGGENSYIGGLVGQISRGKIENSYSTCNVDGLATNNVYIAGLVGSISSTNVIINNSYSIGFVKPTGFYTGGLIGYDSAGGTILNSFWDNETSGKASSIWGGVPKTTEEMKDINTFNSIWNIEYTSNDLNDGYPYLGWENDNETTWLIYTSGISTSYCNGNYTGGDWTIDSPITCENEVIIVDGNIVLNSVLNLTNITLILEGNFTVSGNLDVNSSFINFTINNSVFTFNPSSNVSINNSDILSKNSSTYYGFYVNDSTIFSVENSYIGYVGDYLGDGLEGIKVNAENAWFNNLSYNNFDNCLFTLLENTNNATIINSNFSSCGVDNYGSNNSIIYNEIESLFCMNGSDNFIGFNTFKNGDIGITETYNNTFFNNVFVNAWIRDLNESMYNEFVFGDVDYGMIEWYSNNYTTGNDSNPINMSLGEKIYIGDNLIGIADISDLNNFNVSAQIIFYNLTWTNDVELYKNGVRCDNTTLCNITYYNSETGTLYAEVSGFSNYTTNESSSEEVNVTLISPSNGDVINTTSTILNYSVNIQSNCTVYHNISGTWTPDCTTNETTGQTCEVNALENEMYMWNVYCVDSTNASNYAWNEINWTFTVDTIPPYVEIISPENRTYGPGEIWINITNSSDTVSVEWYNGFTSSWILYTTPLTVEVTDDGSYILLVRANDTVGNYNYTEVTFTIDATGPIFTTIPADESIVYGNSWTGVTFTATDVSLIEDYFVNDTSNFIINSSGYLNVTGQLAVGTYYVNVSVNDTLGNVNSTIYNLNVTTSTSSCDVLFNETSPLDYSIDFIVYTNCDSDFTLWRNGTAISNGSVQSLAAGTYNFTIIRTDDENYSNVREEETFTINKIESVVYTYLNSVRGNITISNNTEIDINGTLIEGEGTLKLYNNGTLINIGESPLYNLTLFDVVDVYSITTISGETENYTGSEETWYVNVTTENIEPVVELILPDEGATITTATYIFKFNVSAVNDISICKLVIDDSVIDTLTDVEKNVEQNISYNGLSNGEYAWYINCTDVIGTEVQSTEERNFTVNIPVAPSSGSSSSSRNKEDPTFEYEWDCETGLLEIETEEEIEVRLMSLRDYSTYKEESDSNGLVSFELPIDGTFRIFTESTGEFNPLQMDISLDFCDIDIPVVDENETTEEEDEGEVVIPEKNETDRDEEIVPIDTTELEELLKQVEDEIWKGIDEFRDVDEAQNLLRKAKMEFNNKNYDLSEELANQALDLAINGESYKSEPSPEIIETPKEEKEGIDFVSIIIRVGILGALGFIFYKFYFAKK